MSTETAQLIIIGIAGVALVVWIISVIVVRNATKWKRPAEVMGSESEQNTEVVSEDMYARSVVIEGDSRDLLERATAQIVREALSPFGTLKIVNKTSDTIEFEQIGGNFAAQQMQRWFKRAKLQFTSMGGNQTQVEYALELSSYRWMLVLAMIFQILGIIAIGIGAWLLLTYVATDVRPGVRGQSFQMIQCVHFLWPPFLFGMLYSRGRKAVVGQFDAFVHNLPYAKV